ncbi:xylose isomerase [Desulfovibrio sp. JY]|nr:xylose isomerase [Desulfovibrio sp. JY]
MIQNYNCPAAWRLAAPSCVWPETAKVNCRRLARTVPEVGLYLLELDSCLAYGPDDLPQKTYGLAYHLHLPFDLPWERGGTGAFTAMEGLLTKTAHLSPWAMVLHPPRSLTDLEDFLAAMAVTGRDPATLLLENTEDASPEDVLDMAVAAGCGVCLDLGHMLALGQTLPTDRAELVERTRMLHVYSPFGAEGPPPGRSHAHRTLTCLSPEGRDVLVWMLGNLRPRTVVLEVFAPFHLVESMAVLDALTCGKTSEAACGDKA